MAEPQDAPPPRVRDGVPPPLDRRLTQLFARNEGTIAGAIDALTEKLNPVADAAEGLGKRADAEARLLQSLGRIEQASSNADATLTRIHRGLRSYRRILAVVLFVWTAGFAGGGLFAEHKLGLLAGFFPEFALRHQAWEVHGEELRRCYAEARQMNAARRCEIYASPPTTPARQ